MAFAKDVVMRVPIPRTACIKRSDIHGWGVFSTTFIAKGMVIGR